MHRRVASLLPALVLTACTESVPVELASLEARSRLSLDEALVGDIRFVGSGGGRTVLVTREWPYLLRIGEDGSVAPVESGRRRPSPWGGYVLGDSLWIFDQETWARWSLEALAELEHGELPARTVAGAHGCGDRLVAIFAGGQGPAAELVGEFGLRAFDSGAWWTLSDIAAGEQPAIFATAGSSAAVVLRSGEIAVFNGARGSIDVLPCGPLGGRSVAIPQLSRKALPVQPRGIAHVGDAVVWFWAETTGDSRDLTHVGYWVPGSRPRAGRSIAGDVRLFGSGARVWLLDAENATLLELDSAELLPALL